MFQYGYREERYGLEVYGLSIRHHRSARSHENVLCFQWERMNRKTLTQLEARNYAHASTWKTT